MSSLEVTFHKILKVEDITSGKKIFLALTGLLRSKTKPKVLRNKFKKETPRN